MDLIITDQISAVLERLGSKQKSAVVAEAVGLSVVSLTVRSFNEPGVRAAPWPELAAATLAAKIREGTSTAILKRHTLLFRSWRVVEFTSDFVRVGSDRFYAAFHQFGTKRIPARPMLPLVGGPENARFTAFSVERMVSAARAALAGLLKRNGGQPGP